MKNIKMAIVVGLLAGGWAFVALTVGEFAGVTLHAWPVFLAWALFFAAGADNNAAIKVATSSVWGIVWGYLSVYVGMTLLGGTLGVPAGIGLAVAVLAALIVIMMTDIKFLSFGPGAFATWAVYFGTNFDFVGSIAMLMVGVILGVVSVKLTALISK
jgi:hypothetical protein